MNKEQALQVIKQTIDEAVKGGIVPNIETAQQIIIALGIIANELKKEEK